jgi:RNA polymerase sigma-70 factor, ECF subfamily
MKWFGDDKEEKWRAFSEEAMPFLPDLFRVAMWLTRNKDEAEDLVQETMFQGMKSFHRYELGTNCRAWLMAIMHNLNYKRIAKLNRMTLVDDPEEKLMETIPFEPSIPDQITDEQVISALKSVPDTFRDVIVLSDVEEYSYKEVAAILNIPIGTVMSRLYRGRRILRQTLAEHARSYGFGGGREAAAG